MAKAVIFDFDGVVAQSEPVHYLSFSEALAPLGVKIDKARWFKDFAGTGSVSIISRLFEEFGVKEDVREWVEKRKLLYAKMVRKGMVKPTKGLENFLEELDRRGVKKAIASGGHGQNIRLVLENLGLMEAFPVIVGAEDFKRRKPDPEAFLTAAQRLGVKPEECIGIEDSAPGAQAVERAGMKLVVMSSPAVQHLNNKGAIIINDFSEFPFELL